MKALYRLLKLNEQEDQTTQIKDLSVVEYHKSYNSQVVTLYKAVFREEPYCELFYNKEVEEIIQIIDLHLLIDTDNRVIGFVGGKSWENYNEMYPEEYKKLKDVVGNGIKAYYIAELGIAPLKQNKGIGAILFENFLYFQTKNGYKQFFLDTADKNNKAQSLYKKNGFQKLKDIHGNTICRQVTQLRIGGKIESDDRPFYLMQIK